ncbi:MAG: hypothetical protein L6R40_001274 [Gallowayella cf. fulva]|nr:MAG: hypothetical protein L6R40_001274 [Xanthomendoza cf. fulva]
MSELQKSFAKAKLASMPREPLLVPAAFAEEDENAEEQTDELQPLPESAQDEDSSSTSSTSSASSTGTIRPNSKHLFARTTGLRPGKKPLEPLPWTDYFAQEYYLENVRSNETVIHHVYITPPAPKGPLFVLHHGAGSSGLSFALFAIELRKALPSAGILSVEARGHGETTVKSPQGQTKGEPHDLCLDILSSDLSDTIKLVQGKLHWPRLPDMVLVGHSLGGPIVTDVAMRGSLGSAVLGYAVLDVVEVTQLYWQNWFTGLSKKFLEARGGKLLILAGTDRLDKELMIGQMQGKYQLQVFPDAGHFIQEDQPEKTALVVADFYRRNDRSALVLPPKVIKQ